MSPNSSVDYQSFRQEVRTFLAENLTEELREAGRFTAGLISPYEYGIKWQRILHAQGWAAPTWPKEYGGPGWDAPQRYIFAHECGLANAPSWSNMGVILCGPVIMAFGRDDQKKVYLPRMLTGEDFWAQGYSEPGAGSDLASLSMKAESDGDDYLLNGSKIWTTHARYANRMFCLVRTSNAGKKQEGITFLLLDMDTPGIRVEPLVTIAGEQDFNQVFFDDVRVSKRNRIGEENGGWQVAKYLLEFERNNGSSVAGRIRATLENLKGVVKLEGAEADQFFQKALSEVEIELSSLEAMEEQQMVALVKGESPGASGSILSYKSTQLSQRITEIGIEAVGYYVSPEQKAARTPSSNIPAIGPDHALPVMPRYLGQRASSIAGGSDEIQKNIIAKSVLGL